LHEFKRHAHHRHQSDRKGRGRIRDTGFGERTARSVESMVGENLAVAPTARLPDGTVAFGHGEVGAGYARAFGPQRRVRPGIVAEAGGCLAPVDAILLVPLHRGFDGSALKEGQASGIDEEFDASGFAGLAFDEAGMFEGEHHLVNGRRRDTEMALEICLSRGPT
jgi:hypothetical protein